MDLTVQNLLQQLGILEKARNLVAGNQYVKATGTRYKIAATTCALTNPIVTSATYTYQTWSDKIPM